MILANYCYILFQIHNVEDKYCGGVDIRVTLRVNFANYGASG